MIGSQAFFFKCLKLSPVVIIKRYCSGDYDDDGEDDDNENHTGNGNGKNSENDNNNVKPQRLRQWEH